MTVGQLALGIVSYPDIVVFYYMSDTSGQSWMQSEHPVRSMMKDLGTSGREQGARRPARYNRDCGLLPVVVRVAGIPARSGQLFRVFETQLRLPFLQQLFTLLLNQGQAQRNVRLR